jgi:hypothetical protein
LPKLRKVIESALSEPRMTEQTDDLFTALLVSRTSPGTHYRLTASLIRIGRSVSGPHDIRLPKDDLRASREHALLICENGVWFLEDHSRNGTLVNDQVIHNARIRLNNGDRIRIGQSFDVVLRCPSETTQSGEFSSAELGTAVALDQRDQFPNVSTGLWLSPNGIVWRDGKPLPVILSRTEYRLLRYLMQHANEVCAYELVIEAVWGIPKQRENLYELVHRLRRKIEPDPANPRYLQMRVGIGLVLFPRGAPPNK